MAFESYEEARRYAGAISEASQKRSMPPWFAEKGVGNFANDPSLNDSEIALLAAWAEAKAPPGDRDEAPAPREVGRALDHCGAGNGFSDDGRSEGSGGRRS
jgi:hypothetical protein